MAMVRLVDGVGEVKSAWLSMRLVGDGHTRVEGGNKIANAGEDRGGKERREVTGKEEEKDESR